MVYGIPASIHCNTLCQTDLKDSLISIKPILEPTIYANPGRMESVCLFVGQKHRVLRSWPSFSGWWLTYPSEKYEFVSWDDDIPNIYGKIIQMSQTTNQFCMFFLCFCWINALQKLTLMVGIVGAANASGFGRARPGS